MSMLVPVPDDLPGTRDQALEPAAAAVPVTVEDLDDTRVRAVLAVLRGAPLDATAAQWSLDPALLQRWVGTFVTAGTAAVVNRVDPQAALARDRLLAAIATELAHPLHTAQESARRIGERADEPGALVAQTGLLASALKDLDDRVTDARLLLAAALGGLRAERTSVALGTLTARVGIRAVRGRGPDYELDVDEDLFGRVLRDLWRAAELRPRPGKRQLWVREVGPWVELRILRTGEPIDTAVLQAMFEPFAEDHSSTGVTTGLYLARALTVAHGGTLGVDQDDSGAAFWVRIPARSAIVASTALTRRRRPPMAMFRLACGDVMPGCSARFEDTSRDGLLGQVATHAAHDHGITDITPDILAAVQAKIIAA